VELGLLHFEAAGPHEVTIEPVRLGGAALMNLAQVNLHPVDAGGRPVRGRKALLIGIDGLRPDALPAAQTPNLDRLINAGCFTDQAKTSAVTVSGPAWSSLLTGVWPDKHGVHDNTFEGADYGRLGAAPGRVHRLGHRLDPHRPVHRRRHRRRRALRL
jgi:hypothetical protein